MNITVFNNLFHITGKLISSLSNFEVIYAWQYESVSHKKLHRVGRKNPQELTQFSPRSHPRHLVGKRTAQNKTPPKTSQATAM